MTEDEAKTKWCPFARVYNLSIEGHHGAYNRVVIGDEEDAFDSTNDAEGKCVASQCMAWRIFPGRVGEFESPGYCGLAGRPE